MPLFASCGTLYSMDYSSRRQVYQDRAQTGVPTIQQSQPIKRSGVVKSLLGTSDRHQKFRELKRPVKRQFLKDLSAIRKEHAKMRRRFKSQLRRSGDSVTESKARSLAGVSEQTYERNPERAERKILRTYQREEAKQIRKRKIEYQSELKGIRKGLDSPTHQGLSKQGGIHARRDANRVASNRHVAV